MDLIQEQSHQLVQRVSPRLVAANHILELSSLALQQAISTELNDNPALEMVEKETCAVCGGALHGSICPHCLSEQKLDQRSPDVDLEEPYAGTNLVGATDEEEFDPLTMVAAQMTLAEKLLLDLRAMLLPEDMGIAEYLVGNLDENGYLTCSIAETVDLLIVLPERVEVVLAALQSLDPVGIGARDLRECLLIQLDHLVREGTVQPHAREIVARHLKALGERKYGRVAGDLGVSLDDVVAAAEFIREHLNPYPARSYSGPEHGGKAGSGGVMPDVIINRSESGFEVEVIESKRFVLRVAPFYHRLHQDIQRNAERLSEEERHHIQSYVSRAKLFIANINQRRQTLHKITSYLVEAQKEFLVKGVRHLRPLTRAQVAAHLGLHESTVSRATAAKYAMLPNRRVISFDQFFRQSLSVKDVIKEIVDDEGQPLPDQEIAAKLAERGIQIARRTVAKYREQLGILPSVLR